ncbi:MAG: hypothetical protein H0V17_12925, partial [Deltaproteobacteria bacterium]|nr:hypothetical protein [Deltaproteobacteria bacterium]
FVALHVLGVVVCMAVGPWQRIWLCSALGFAVGLACMVFVSLGPLLLGAFNFGVMAVLYATLLGVCISVAVNRQRWTRRTLQAAGIGVLGFAALCFPFCYWNFSAFSYDSHMFVMYGRAIGADGHLSSDMLQHLDKWGMFQVVAHAMSAFVKQDYLYGLAPAFAVSMLATFAVVLGEALGELRVGTRHRALWICLAVIVLLAIPLFRFHVVYVHSNMGSSGYLLFFVTMFWLAEVKNDASYLPIAFLSLLAFTVLRVEAVPFALGFLLLTVMTTRVPRQQIVRWYLLYTVVLVAWFALLASIVPTDSVYLTPKKCLLFAAAIALLFAYWLVRDRWWFRRLTPYIPHLTVVACGLGIVAAYLTNEANMRESAEIWLDDLWTSTWWASIWKYVVVLAIVGVFLPAPPFRKSLVLGVWLFFGLILILSSTGTAFGPDIDGSLIRMTIHILPIVVFYGALKFAPLLAATRER